MKPSLPVLALALLPLAFPGIFQAPAPPAMKWYKGNTHAHTTESDGDSTPEEVALWYKERAYNFLVLSDHNTFVRTQELQTKHGVRDKFLLIPGEEVTNGFDGKSIHVNGLNTKKVIGQQMGTSILEILQKSVDAIRQQGGVPHINHPSFNWAMTAEHLQQVKDNKLFEIYSGHPQANNLGGGDTPSLEAAWDTILSNGILLYGLAVDDAHHFKRPWNTELALPGRGWIMVRSPALEPGAIVAAMERGDFYATTGVYLKNVDVTAERMIVIVSKDVFSKYRIQFIGKDGVVLQESLDSPATYTFKGNELYVRARVVESNGRTAWIQPVFLKPPVAAAELAHGHVH